MVFAANMRLLVSDNVFHILFIHLEWQIYVWFENAEHKGRNHAFALKNVVPKQNSRANFSFYTEIADNCIDKHSRNPRNPQLHQNRYPYLQRIRTCSRIRRKETFHNRIYKIVDNRNTGMNCRGFIRHDFRTDCFRTRYKTHSTFNRKGTNQPDCNNSP